MAINPQAIMQTSQGTAAALKGSPASPVVSTPTPTPQPQRKFFTGSTWNKAMDVIRIPEYALAGAGKAGVAKRDELIGGKKGFVGFQNLAPIVGSAIKGAFSGVKNRTEFGTQPENYNAGAQLGIKSRTGQQAYNFATSLAAPVFPVGKAAKIVSKIPGAAKIVEKAGTVGTKALELARKTPAIYKTVEKVYPAFRVPELGKMTAELDTRVQTRLNDLVNTIKPLAEGLTPVEQKRIGQLMEGGITAFNDSKYQQIATTMNKLADDIGQEAVDLGLMAPEQFAKYKGRYMGHIWAEAVKEGPDAMMKRGLVPSVGTSRHFSERKGAQGYIKEFAPASFKTLAEEVKDIEVARFYDDIIKRYGVDAQEKATIADTINNALNAVIRDTKKPIAGLGVEAANQPGFVETSNIGNYLLNVFKQYQPAKATAKSVGADVGSKIVGKTPKEIEKWVIKQQAAFKQLFGFTPDKSQLVSVINRVGELPGIKQAKNLLKTGRAERTIPEGFQYAPEVIQKGKAGKLLKDVALPNEVIDYIKITQNIPANTIFDKALNLWKAGKTIWNPAYHIRNVISNQILSDMSTGKGLLNTVMDYAQSVAQYRGKGTQLFVDAAERGGLIKQEHFGRAFDDLLEQAKLFERGKWDKIAEFPRALQNASEETAKLNVFTSWVEKFADDVGKTVEEALADPLIIKQAVAKAEKAIFSPYKIGAGERALMGRLIPFYSFTRQVILFTPETLVNRPKTLAKYPRIKTGVEGFSEDVVPDEKRPDWMQQSVQLPFKFKGKNIAFDPTYVYPFGNLGDAQSGKLPFGLSLRPELTELAEQAANKDFFFDKEMATSNIPGVGTDVFSTKPRRAGSQRLAHVLNTAMPAAYRTVQGKLVPAFAGVPDYAGRDRSKAMAILDAIGIKTSILYPEDQEKFNRLDKKTKLKSIDNEKRSLMRDKRLSPAQKKELVNELLIERRKAMAGN